MTPSLSLALEEYDIMGWRADKRSSLGRTLSLSPTLTYPISPFSHSGIAFA